MLFFYFFLFIYFVFFLLSRFLLILPIEAELCICTWQIHGIYVILCKSGPHFCLLRLVMVDLLLFSGPLCCGASVIGHKIGFWLRPDCNSLLLLLYPVPAKWAKVLHAEPDRTWTRTEQNNCYVCPSKTKLLLPACLTAWPHFRVSIAGCLSPWISPLRIVYRIKENQMKRKLAKCKLFLPFNVQSFSVHNTFEWFGFLDCGKHPHSSLPPPTHTPRTLCI